MAIDEKQLQALIDRAAISEVQIRYATGVDMRDWALYRSCFTDEIETDFSSAGGTTPQRMKADDWVEYARRTINGMKATQHMITNHVITLDGDEATDTVRTTKIGEQVSLPSASGGAFTANESLDL